MGIITDILKEVPLSAVLRERLTELEKKHEALERENADLRRVNAELKGQVAKLTGVPILEVIEKNILLLLAEAETLPVSHIALNLKEKKAKVEFYLQRMEEYGIVCGSHYYTGQESEYSLGQKGREFLVSNNLI